MKIDSTVNNSFSIQRKNSAISSLEQCFSELKVDNSSTEQLENTLKDLTLEDVKDKLIERGPLPPKTTKPPKNKPYQKVTENVYVNHNCGGTAFSIAEISYQNYDNIYDPSPYYNFEANNNQTTLNECLNLCNCESCLLKDLNSSELLERFYNSLHKIEQNDSAQLQHSPKVTQLNITNINHTLTGDHTDESTSFKIYPEFIKPSVSRTSHYSGDNPSPCKIYSEFIKPSVRRISHDSGFQSDNPSPCSDYVLSPKPSFSLQPSKIENVTSHLRKILPKTKEMQQREENNIKGTPKTNNSQTKQMSKQNITEKTTKQMQKKEENIVNDILKTKNQTKEKSKQSTTEKSAKERLESTLNFQIKQVKWIDIVVRKSNDEVFETCNRGQTILHKLLEGDEEFKAESLYAIVEKMRKHPDKCSGIISAQSSICDTIKQNKHPQLWLDYFCEAVQIIQREMENDQSRN